MTEIAIARVTDNTDVARFAESTALDKYIKNVRAMNRRTAVE